MFIKIVLLKKYKLDLQLKQLNTQNQKKTNACQRQTQTGLKQEEIKPFLNKQKEEY